MLILVLSQRHLSQVRNVVSRYFYLAQMSMYEIPVSYGKPKCFKSVEKYTCQMSQNRKWHQKLKFRQLYPIDKYPDSENVENEKSLFFSSYNIFLVLRYLSLKYNKHEKIPELTDAMAFIWMQTEATELSEMIIKEKHHFKI